MIATSSDGVKWYAGPDDNGGIGYSYEKAKRGTAIEAIIGLGRYGEMFSTQFGMGYDSSVNCWLITKYNDMKVWSMSSYGGGSTGMTERRGARPSFYLKSDVKIKSGTGTVNSPFEITM